MFYRLLVTSSLILPTTSQAVLAESIDVEFTGTVPEQITVSTPTIDITKITTNTTYKNNQKTVNTVIPLTFTINSNISTNITISTTSTLSGANTLIASKNSRLASAPRHPTPISSNFTAPAGTTNLEAPVQQQSSHPESNNVIILTITP